ncbi:MAG TPA: GNAT family protein [Steroidobacteraceae bacterium]|jgi:RimJ/RimL family protein N-acetyltransferase|nr:GNAT family protein [Steroidobacteraceae bacterium]
MDPILLDFPDQFETERLIVRAPRPGDGWIVDEAIRESVNELSPWMPWMHPVQTVEQTEAFVRRAAAQWLTREALPMHLWRKGDGVFVGGSGLHHIDWSVPSMETGYWVRTSLAGQGYITEAVLEITAFAFKHLGAQRLEIRCDARNTRSAAVAERAGYTLEARLHHHARDVNGGLRDTLVYVKFPDA